ncbi:hypothetical protein ABFS83_01G105400 [Erythranthe nasuta]
MQHQQQGGGGGGTAAAGGVGEMIFGTDEHQKLGDLGIAEAASPISSRPPAGTGNNNFEEMMRVTAAEGGGGGSGNRWPRQETLALLQIRSEMDAVFRDATLKGPLWEQVSRKLAELGYQRNAKKCKEKFENVQKYYKRTKETRGGRHDGKSYKFFDQLEALNTSAPSTTTTPTSENLVHHHHHILPITTTSLPAAPPVLREPPSAPPPPPPPLFSTVGVSFSSSSDEEQEDDDEEMEAELGDDINLMMRRKRKRRSGGGNSSSSSSEERMMEFLEGVVKQVMQKQESMQQKFLHAIEKREHDRMIREEAWKRQDMARLARQQDLMAHERSISASRDAAIVAFLEKITGQKVNLPHHNPPPPPPPPTNNYSMQQLMIPTDKITENSSREMVVAVVPPEKQIQQHDQLTTTGGTGSSSRWPKAEVLALIQLRSGLEHRYQETGLPKGPLWEEISARMKGIGYNRNAKRCKEKWENINKYFKKVKESDKKRPEDTKTCPYFHELDELYRKKVLGNTSGTTTTTILGGAAAFPEQERHQQDVVGMMSSEDNKNDQLQASSSLFGEQSQANIGGGAKQKPC